MNRKGWLYLLVTSLVAMVLLPATAHAGSIDISLQSTSLTGAAGATLVFDATLTNLTASTIYLNGDGATTSSLFLTVDDSFFLTNAPLSLASGATSGPFAIFDVKIAPGTPVGTYAFNAFTILGGLDGLTLNPIGSAQFTVTVTAGTPLPEPPTLWLVVGSGVLALGLRKRMQSQAR